jgi:hypothetical protein
MTAPSPVLYLTLVDASGAPVRTLAVMDSGEVVPTDDAVPELTVVIAAPLEGREDVATLLASGRVKVLAGGALLAAHAKRVASAVVEGGGIAAEP